MSLSDKIEFAYGDVKAIRVVHVKEFIKKLKAMIEQDLPLVNLTIRVKDIIDELAGKELANGQRRISHEDIVFN